ncbi:MAG TPA: branched-chain amino acid ABC transporter substrate-binding protein [Gaiellaceae bacterium]|nr:branched-chain amino acid ABC transporter substrate-binding protein [Gaiellaceae bacterium]
MRKGGFWFLVAFVFGVLAFAAAGCGGDDDGGGGGVTALPSASCGAIRYEGEGDPDYLIASDLPLQGANRALTTEMADAIEFILKQRDWKAGDYKIGYQSCDDSTAQAGSWDSAKCSSNARAYANNEDVIGVIGTFNSGCAKLEIPVNNRAPDGPLAMISPANTYPGLTIGGPGTEQGEPDNYYPTGKRNYARVVWNDQFQGAAGAQLAQDLKLKKVYVLTDKETYGNGIANLFVRYAKKLGVQTLPGTPQAWDKNASSYEAIASRIQASGADAVFLGGIVCNNGGKLIKDLRAGLGANVTIVGPDGWTPISATVQGAGQAAEGMYITQPGIPPDRLKGAGKKFVDDFTAEVGHAPDPYTNYAAQAAQIMLDSIADSDGTRPKVAEGLFNRDVKDGILGDFKIDENGDTTLGTVAVFRIQGGKGVFNKLITPELSFVKG